MTKFGSLAKLADTNRRVLNLYDSYIMGTRNLHDEARVLAHILTKNAPADGAPGRDRTGTWSASAAGHCLREQQFTYLGFPVAPVDADRQNIFDNGDFLHLRYQVAGMIGGWLRDVEVPLTYGSNVRGTMDGDLVWNEVLELKSINDRGYKSVMEFGPKEDHKCQATAYMLCTGYTTARFVYENKNDNHNCEFVFELEEGYQAKVLRDWAYLDELTEQRTLSPMLHECLQGKGMFRWCSYAQLCEHARYPRTKIKLVS